MTGCTGDANPTPSQQQWRSPHLGRDIDCILSPIANNEQHLDDRDRRTTHRLPPSFADTMAALCTAPVAALARAPAAARVPRAKSLFGGVAVPKTKRPVSRRRGSSASIAVRASAGVETATTAASQAVSEIALAGIDTTSFDELFVNVASFILPAWGVVVGSIFIFGTIAKLAFPEKYDAAVYDGKAKEMVADEIIDLDNLSAVDLAAVAELEAERAANK